MLRPQICRVGVLNTAFLSPTIQMKLHRHTHTHTHTHKHAHTHTHTHRQTHTHTHTHKHAHTHTHTHRQTHTHTHRSTFKGNMDNRCLFPVLCPILYSSSNFQCVCTVRFQIHITRALS